MLHRNVRHRDVRCGRVFRDGLGGCTRRPNRTGLWGGSRREHFQEHHRLGIERLATLHRTTQRGHRAGQQLVHGLHILLEGGAGIVALGFGAGVSGAGAMADENGARLSLLLLLTVGAGFSGGALTTVDDPLRLVLEDDSSLWRLAEV